MNPLLRRNLRWLLPAVVILASVWFFRPPGDAPETPRPPLAERPAAAPITNAPASTRDWNRWRAQLPATTPAIEDVTTWPANRAVPFEQFRACLPTRAHARLTR